MVFRNFILLDKKYQRILNPFFHRNYVDFIKMKGLVELTATNNNVWEQLVSQHLNTNGSGFKYGLWHSSFIAILKKLNLYCYVMFKRHNIKLPKLCKSRISVIFRAEGYCKHSSCTWSTNIIKAPIKVKEDLTVSTEFEGTTIWHKVGKTSKTNSKCWTSQTQGPCFKDTVVQIM